MSFFNQHFFNYANTCRNWTFQRFAMVAEKKERNGTNEKSDNRQDSNTVPRLVAPIFYRLSYSVCRQIPNFNLYKLTNLLFIPPLSFLHVDIHRHTVLLIVSVHICPQLVPFFLYSNFIFIIFYVVFESTLLNYANPCRNWTFQRFAMVAENKERNGTN